MQYQTDKYKNGLISIYEEVLAPNKDKECVLLEVGTYVGGSLQYYGNYSPKWTVVGVDIMTPKLELPSNATFFPVDQNKPETFEKALSQGPFDIIIDDGAHQTKETATTFKTCWPHLKPGGLYVIEDWGVGYWEKQEYRGMKELVLDLISRKEGIEKYRVELSPKHSICLLWKS